MSHDQPSSTEEQSLVARTVETGKETAQQGLEKAKEAGQQAGEQARGAVTRQLDERSTQAGRQVGTLAETIGRVGSQLREEGQEGQAKVAEGAAERVQRLGTYLQEGSGDQFLHDVEDFARRRPWAVAAGAFVAGIVASRFLKASAERRSQATNGSNRFNERLATAGRSSGASDEPQEWHSPEPLVPSLEQP